MEQTNVAKIYEWLNVAATEIEQHQDLPYLDALAISMETLFYRDVREDFDDLITHKLTQLLKQIEGESWTVEERRKGIQLAILKGMQSSVQDQHLITPESIALIVGYLADKLFLNKEKIRVFDPVVGTGNLLMTVLDTLPMEKEAYASEVDSTLIQLALNNANLQEKEVEFFQQDSLQPFLLDPVDLVVADLPVGYYPDDEQAKRYTLSSNSGHSYSHHLFIEQGLHYTLPGGYLILIIPEFLFEGEEAQKLHTFIHENAHIIGLLRLPESAFKQKRNVKSIFILQKKGKDTELPKQPLLAQLPSLKDTKAMQNILDQVNEWFIKYRKE